VDASKSSITHELRKSSVGRRAVVRSGLIGATTLSLTVVGWLPLGRQSSASARTGTMHPRDCMGVSGMGKPCWGGTVSSSYCGSDGWFRTDSGYYPIVNCAGYNAWRWPAGPGLYRCADGKRRYSDGSTSGVLICRFYT
jgi:hypothetical protein